MNRLQIWGMFILFITSCYGDLVHLKNGRILEGKVTDKSESILLEIPTGYMEIPKSMIAKITPAETAIDIFARKKATLDENDANGWFDLYLWAKNNKFSKEDLLLTLDKVILADPNHELAKDAILDLLIDDEEIVVEEEVEEEIEPTTEEIIEEVVIEEEEINPEQNFGLLPIEQAFNYQSYSDFENFIDEIYEKQLLFPVDRFAGRGGLNLLFNFIFFKAQKAGFSHEDSRDLANKYKNIAGAGGDQAVKVFQRTFFTMRRLERQRNPKRPLSATNRFQDVTDPGLFLFFTRFAAKVASGGSTADGDFNSAYSFLFFKLSSNNYKSLGLPEYDAYRISLKCAAIIAAGGGVIRFKQAFGFHLRQFRDLNRNMREAIPYAIQEALLEVQQPRRFFRRVINDD